MAQLPARASHDNAGAQRKTHRIGTFLEDPAAVNPRNDTNKQDKARSGSAFVSSH
jgi:hypothetical protein